MATAPPARAGSDLLLLVLPARARPLACLHEVHVKLDGHFCARIDVDRLRSDGARAGRRQARGASAKLRAAAVLLDAAAAAHAAEAPAQPAGHLGKGRHSDERRPMTEGWEPKIINNRAALALFT